LLNFGENFSKFSISKKWGENKEKRIHSQDPTLIHLLMGAFTSRVKMKKSVGRKKNLEDKGVGKEIINFKFLK
jgi:hypothetical protein